MTSRRYWRTNSPDPRKRLKKPWIKPVHEESVVPMDMLRHVLRQRPTYVSIARIRRRAIIAVLVATGRVEWMKALSVPDVLGLSMPRYGWQWVAHWLNYRIRRVGQGGHWCDSPPEFTISRKRSPSVVLRVQLGLEVSKMGWPVFTPGQIARAGVPSRPWKKKEIRRNNGPRTWPVNEDPVDFGVWAKRVVQWYPWVRDLQEIVGIEPKRVYRPARLSR